MSSRSVLNTKCSICGETYYYHTKQANGHFFIPASEPDLSPDAPTDKDGFSEILKEMQALRDKKAKDYGGVTGTDNLRASEGFGVPAWLGAIIRLTDKIVRIQSFTRNKQLVNESLEDSLIDICVYGVRALQLYREANHE